MRFNLYKTILDNDTNDTLDNKKCIKQQDRTIRKKADFLKMFPRVLGNISECCRAINIGRKTYYRWLEDDPEFAKDVEIANENLVDWLETQLYRAAESGNAACIIFGLVNKGAKRGWQHVTKVKREIENKIGIKIELVDSTEQEMIIDNTDANINQLPESEQGSSG
jgi:predicted DNA-binding transcriptional regulator AlpA